MYTFIAGSILEFDYENYKGVISRRRVRLLGLNYGSNEWYPEDQWFAHCYDLHKKAARSFALVKIDARKITVDIKATVMELEE